MKALPLLLLFAWACQSSPPPPKWESRVDSTIAYHHERGHFDGTLVIGNRDTILYERVVGTANRTWNIPMSLDTRMDIASVNKSFQAALILMAADEGLLSIDDPLALFFPDLSFDSTITLHHLLTHTSGLPDYNGVDESLSANEYQPLKRLHFEPEVYAAFIAGLPRIGPPENQFHYSNFGYHLLALVVEKVYERPFEEVLERKITSPLGMTRTYASQNNQTVHENTADGYRWSSSDRTYIKNSFIDQSLGRRVFSNAHDLWKWVNGLPAILSPESYSLMLTNHLPSLGISGTYGYGWVVHDTQEYDYGRLNIEPPYVLHGGSTEGFKSMVIQIHQGDWIIAFTVNSGSELNELELGRDLVKMLPL